MSTCNELPHSYLSIRRATASINQARGSAERTESTGCLSAARTSVLLCGKNLFVPREELAQQMCLGTRCTAVPSWPTRPAGHLGATHSRAAGPCQPARHCPSCEAVLLFSGLESGDPVCWWEQRKTETNSQRGLQERQGLLCKTSSGRYT